MASSLSLVCELSGESIVAAAAAAASNAGDGSSTIPPPPEVVVTPSGHLCQKRLLLQKLLENGGRDPFDESRPLSEDDLIPLAQVQQAAGGGNGKSKAMFLPPIPPPRTSSTLTFPSLLMTLQQEYEAVLLELFDTRRALQETRQELSQALYQNDAAVRVVARLAAERDEARNLYQSQQLQQGSEEPTAKRARIETTTQQQQQQQQQQGPLVNDIPAQDLQSMVEAWESLHASRKKRQKEAVAAAPEPDQLQAMLTSSALEVKAWHKTKCKGLTALSGTATADDASSFLILSAGKDKHACLYNLDKSLVVHNLTPSTAITAAQATSKYLLVGCSGSENAAAAAATLAVYRTETADLLGTGTCPTTATDLSQPQQNVVVDVVLHPNQRHIVAAVANGSICIFRLPSDDGESSSSTTKSIPCIATLQQQQQQEQQNTHTTICGCLHPDGLIYVAGTLQGSLLIWDLKNKALASTLQQQQPPPPSSSSETSAVVAVDCSNNGYYIAAAYATGHVLVWDLRKQVVVATVNDPSSSTTSSEDEQPPPLSAVHAVRFDASGKYLAYAGARTVSKEGEEATTITGEIRITTTKIWKVTALTRQNLIPVLLEEEDESKTSTMNMEWKHLAWTHTNGLVTATLQHRNVLVFRHSTPIKGEDVAMDTK